MLFSLFIDLCSLFGISEYLDEAMLIPKNTSVLIRRVPGRPRMPIVTDPKYYLITYKLLITLLSSKCLVVIVQSIKHRFSTVNTI